LTAKPKFLKTTRERFGPHPRQFIDDVLCIYGPDTQSKGGHAKAEKNAGTLKMRDQHIRALFAERRKAPGAKRHEIVALLAKTYHRSTDRINRILRKG
jgi:hypothetical protein